MMRKIESWSKKIGILFVWIIFISLIIVSFMAVGGRFTNLVMKESNIIIRFLQTKNDADCIIINEGERGIMIDTGEQVDGKMILKELEQAGITTLDYLILSHPDLDHIGGALDIIQNIPVSKVVQPYFDGDSEEIQKISRYCKEEGIPILYPTRTWRLKTDYIHCIIYPSLEKHYKENNNYSLAVLAEHEKTRMFFAGDAQRKRIEELLCMNLPQVTIYKVPHHGKGNSVTDKMFEKLKPDFAIITSEKADKEVQDSCNKWGTEMFFTREKMIIFESDGQRLNLVN